MLLMQSISRSQERLVRGVEMHVRCVLLHSHLTLTNDKCPHVDIDIQPNTATPGAVVLPLTCSCVVVPAVVVDIHLLFVVAPVLPSGCPPSTSLTHAAITTLVDYIALTRAGSGDIGAGAGAGADAGAATARVGASCSRSAMCVWPLHISHALVRCLLAAGAAAVRVFVVACTATPAVQLWFRVRRWSGGSVGTLYVRISSLAEACKETCGPGTMYYFATNDMSQPVKLPPEWDPADTTWEALCRGELLAPRVILVLPDADRAGSAASTPQRNRGTVGVPLPDDFSDMFATVGTSADGASTSQSSAWSNSIHCAWHDQCTITGGAASFDVLQAAHIVSQGNKWATQWPHTTERQYSTTWDAARRLLKQTEFRAFLMYKAAAEAPDGMAHAFGDLNVPWNGLLLQQHLHSTFDNFDLSLYPRGKDMLCRVWRRPDVNKNDSATDVARRDALVQLDGAACAAWRRRWAAADHLRWARRLLALHHGVCAVKHLLHLQKQDEADRKYPLKDAEEAALLAQSLIAASVKVFEASSLQRVVQEDGGA